MGEHFHSFLLVFFMFFYIKNDIGTTNPARHYVKKDEKSVIFVPVTEYSIDFAFIKT